MPRLNLTNLETAALAAGLSNVATTATLSSATGLPATPFRMTVYPASGSGTPSNQAPEIIEVPLGGQSGTALSGLLRGQDGTTASAWATTDWVDIRYTADHYAELLGATYPPDFGRVNISIVDQAHALVYKAASGAISLGSGLMVPGAQSGIATGGYGQTLWLASGLSAIVAAPTGGATHGVAATAICKFYVLPAATGDLAHFGFAPNINGAASTTVPGAVCRVYYDGTALTTVLAYASASHATEQTVTASTGITDTNWHQITVFIFGGIPYLYIDGALVATGTNVFAAADILTGSLLATNSNGASTSTTNVTLQTKGVQFVEGWR